MSKRSRFSLLLSVQLVLVLLLLEGGLRLLEPHHRGLSSLLYLPASTSDLDGFDSLEELLNSSIVGFTPYEERAGFILNSRSFRTKEYMGRARSDAYRIMCLGDSFTDATIGVPYADMWHVLLEEQLQRTEDRPVEVFALGVQDVGPGISLRVWQFEHGFILPDLVVFALFVGNDFTDEQGYRPQRLTDVTAARVSYTFRLARNLFRVWEQHSFGRDALLDVSERGTHERGGIDLGGMWPVQEHPGDEEAYLKRKKRFLYWLRRDRQETFSTYLKDVRDVLYRFSAEVRNAGSDFVVMIIPDEFQVSESVRQRSLEFSGRAANEIDVDSPQRYLREVLERAGIAYLDLLPAFRDAGPRESLYLKNDGHWNIEGNHLAAQTLATYVEEGFSRDGLRLSGNASGLAASEHRFESPTEKALAADASDAAHQSGRSAKPSARTPVDATPESIIGFVDSINHSVSPSLTGGEPLVIRGWALDKQAGAPVPKVEALVNGKVIGATTEFHNRPGVVEHFDRQDYEKSGWVIEAPLPDMEPGRYQLEARVVTEDGSTGALIPKVFDVVE